MYYNGWMIFAYVVCSIATFVWKSEHLPYPGYLLGWETAAFSLLTLIDISRLMIGYKGNRTRSVAALAVFLLLCIPVAIGCAYFIDWQTYIVRLDLIIFSIAIGFTGIEFILGLVTLISFASG